MRKGKFNTPNFYKIYNQYKILVEHQIRSLIENKKPNSIYKPIEYVLRSGGKRFRAVLVLLACEAVGGNSKQALNAAVAIEILHNFTLVHDDVMDHAELRRGKQTVHKRWDEGIAILAGDAMIAQAYNIMLKTKSPRFREIISVYTDALIQVCEGQGYDKEFEKQRKLSINDYFRMISKKTGRVITAAIEIGGLIGGGTTRQINALRKYGEYLSRAFQIQDDLLDIVGSASNFGKKIGGDVREGKKTYLLIKAIEQANEADLKLLNQIKPGFGMIQAQIIEVKKLYKRTGALEAAREEIARSTMEAQLALDSLPEIRNKIMFFWLSNQLLERNS